MSSVREELGEAQQAVLDSLLAHGRVPPGFDAAGIRATRSALLRKRRRTVARAWPELTAGLEADFLDLFNRYTDTHPGAPVGGPAVDGWQFARALKAEGRFPGRARGELAAFELQHRVRDGVAHHRRAGLRLVMLSNPRRLALGLKGLRGARWWILRLGS